MKAYGNQNDQPNSLKYYLQALEMYKRLNIGDDIDTANCLINIGIVCFNLKFQEMALKYSLEGINMKDKISNYFV